MKQVDPDEALVWLRGHPGHHVDGEAITGFELEGWEASTWVLRSMFKRQRTASTDTYQDLRRSALGAGRAEPLIVGGVDLDERCVATGIPLGRTEEPGPGWQRLLWSELARRLPARMSQCGHPPGAGWFPFRSWPANIRPPSEGSLDPLALRALLEVLGTRSSNGSLTETTCFFGTLAARSHAPTVFLCPLVEVNELYRHNDVRASPTNFWASDESWFVYTDWDLLATKVSGSARLISDLRAHPVLETTEYP